VAGIAAVSVLALVSLGSREFGIGGSAAAPLTTTDRDAGSDTVRIWTDAGGDDGSPPAAPGVAEVSTAADSGSDSGEVFAVHVASFRDVERARRFLGELRATTGEEIRITPTETATGLWYRVLVGEYRSADRAEALGAELRSSRDLAFTHIVRLIRPEESPS
jgi:hypothetical protein